VIVDNLYDSIDYLKAHGDKIAFTGVAFVVFYVTAIWNIRRLQEPRRWRLTAVAFVAVLALYGLLARRSGGYFSFMLYQDRGSPFGVFPQGYVARALELDLQRRSQNARRFSFKATRKTTVDEPETYVLVIGESARPDHFGVYGYHRKTTPLLDQQTGLIAFRNVVSQASVTKDAVPFILTRGSAQDPARTTDERSIVSVYRELGFETYWLSTQQRDLTTGLINRFAAESATARFFERRYDTFLLNELNQARTSTPSGNQKRFIVIHTSGSHFYYPTRYPAEYAIFPAGTLSTPQETINAYDNSIAFTDYFLSQVIHALEQTPGQKAMLYVSDHGENLSDDDRKLFGHMMNTRYDLPVPMLLWVSPELQARFPDKIANAKANVARRLTTRSVFYTLQDLADASLVGDEPDAQALSVFRKDCAEPKRYVSTDSRPFDFDAKFPDYQRPEPIAR
jgi:heptose-I-phosphate ethanolaminephosphotransferase